jgi:hypothetical protein
MTLRFIEPCFAASTHKKIFAPRLSMQRMTCRKPLSHKQFRVFIRIRSRLGNGWNSPLLSGVLYDESAAKT